MSQVAKSDFYAFLYRMTYISRWGLMRNTISENIKEHSLDVAILSHALVVIKNTYFNGVLSPEKAALYAIFHDATEIFTGDMPTPVKYVNENFREAFLTVENRAKDKLLSMLPDEMKGEYKKIFDYEEDNIEYKQIVKSADKLAALIKCIEEVKSGNKEFAKAAAEYEKKLAESEFPEVRFFLDNFLEGYKLSLDELNLGLK